MPFRQDLSRLSRWANRANSETNRWRETFLAMVGLSYSHIRKDFQQANSAYSQIERDFHEMTNQFTGGINEDSDNEPQARDESKSGQVFLSPQPKQRRIFTRRNALIIGGASVVSLFGIGAGATLLSQSRLNATDPEVPNAVAGLVWSPDGKSLASYNDTGNVQIWEAMSGRRKYTFAKVASITQLAWSPDSSMLAIGTDAAGLNGSRSDETLKIFHSATGTLSRSLKLTLADGTSASSSYVAWSPDGRYIATGDAGMLGSIGVWSTTDWDAVPIKQLPGQYTEVRGLGWSPDSQKLLLIFDAASVRDDKMLGMVLIWDMQTQRALLTKQVEIGDGDGPLLDSGKGVELNIGGATWSPDGTMFALGANQQALVFRSNGQLCFKRGIFANHALAPILAWSPTNLQRLAGWFAPDPTIYVWNPFTNQLIQRYANTALRSGVSLSWSPDGKYLAFSDGNGVQFRSVE